jgi:hypothetical protein
MSDSVLRSLERRHARGEISTSELKAARARVDPVVVLDMALVDLTEKIRAKVIDRINRSLTTTGFLDQGLARIAEELRGNVPGMVVANAVPYETRYDLGPAARAGEVPAFEIIVSEPNAVTGESMAGHYCIVSRASGVIWPLRALDRSGEYLVRPFDPCGHLLDRHGGAGALEHNSTGWTGFTPYVSGSRKQRRVNKECERLAQECAGLPRLIEWRV